MDPLPLAQELRRRVPVRARRGRACNLYQQDSSGSATSKWYYHHYLVSFGTNIMNMESDIAFVAIYNSPCSV